MVLLGRKLYFSKDPEGEWSKLLPEGGGQMPISIEPHITCDFPGGSGPPIPPLDPHMNRGAVKTYRNRSLNMRTDKRAYAEF